MNKDVLIKTHDERSGTKVGNYRWFIAFLLLAATTINYIDRQIFGLLKPELEVVFSWTEADYSRIVMAFTARLSHYRFFRFSLVNCLAYVLFYPGKTETFK